VREPWVLSVRAQAVKVLGVGQLLVVVVLQLVVVVVRARSV
jgi:hypothetical protein